MGTVRVYHGRHYWVNTCNKLDQWIEWESLSAEIKHSQRVTHIEGSQVAVLLFERKDSISDGKIIDGYIDQFERSQFNIIPQGVKAMVMEFYPVGIECDSKNDDLGAALFGKNILFTNECLAIWKERLETNKHT